MRLYSIYGPWEEPDRLIPKLVECGFVNTYPPLVNPDTTRDFVYIDDCVEATLNFFHSQHHGPINIGSEEQVSINQMIKIIESFSGNKYNNIYQLDKPKGVR